jgi:hypothetical protein
MNVNGSNDILLRRALLSDAIFEVICGVLFILIASVLVVGGISPISLVFLITRIILGGVAVLLFWMQRQAQINLPLVRLVMILNALFAVGGLVGLLILWALLADMARLIGVLIIAGLAIFAALEYAGLRKITP